MRTLSYIIFCMIYHRCMRNIIDFFLILHTNAFIYNVSEEAIYSFVNVL